MARNRAKFLLPRDQDLGALGPFIEPFVEYVAAAGYSPHSLIDYCAAARQFSRWTHHIGITPANIDAGTIEQYARQRCELISSRLRSCRASTSIHYVRRFIDFLITQEVLRPVPPPPAKPIDVRVVRFQEWLLHQRGLTEKTAKLLGGIVTQLLRRLGTDPAAYDASLVRGIILDAAKTYPKATVSNMVVALRGYLKFLAADGACAPWLHQAVPSVPRWRLSALPRYLPSSDVERLILSCDLSTAYGIRDRAILLLLARLGLRAGDIVAMRLTDIAWIDGTIRVDGKGRRTVRLPLPQDAGDAILAYLDQARPRVACDHVFLRGQAPHTPFGGSGSISRVVDAALTRAGITNAPTRGAHLLRHSAATSMLRAGATLDCIGAILRHRSTDATAHYAKVDVKMLQMIVQPWPGDVVC